MEVSKLSAEADTEGQPASEIAGERGMRVELAQHLRPLFRTFVLLTLTTGILFPLALAALARPLFSRAANGSLVLRDGDTVGSEWIAQDFSGLGYFSPRPSAAGKGYDATASGGTNLGPNNPKLGTEARELADQYRQRNGLPADIPLPVDAVTRSGSGLDPHISPTNAELQVERVARARGLPAEQVRRLVAEHTLGRQFGLLGEPRVAVLPLNAALDQFSRDR